MKRLLIIAMLAASASACVETNQPVQLLGAVALSPGDCSEASDRPEPYSGDLNFTYGKQYIIGFRFFTALTTSDNDRGNDFYAEEIVLRYESKNPETTFKEETRPIYRVVEPETNDEIIRVEMIGTEARKTLETAVPALPERMTLLVFAKVRGKLSSGAEVETNEVRFPIEVYRHGEATCPPGFQLGASDPAFPCFRPGQDGFSFFCEEAPGS